NRSWRAKEWTASDDRVRGGQSKSYLNISPDDKTANFNGILDIKALGGAGFASQRTSSVVAPYDLSVYDGILLELVRADRKNYTFILKDAILPTDPESESDREQSTISYEFDFVISNEHSVFVYIPWSQFKATYRGKDQSDVPPLNTRCVRRFSVMMRSHFGEQEGSFTLVIRGIYAVQVGKP
ncbi:NADH:ubiquinone oxidoreductase complex I intermediate-associated protein 30, partial [Rickenella mellea]